eukprot:3104358-Pleurochrysis_carterae.AAC.1
MVRMPQERAWRRLAIPNNKDDLLMTGCSSCCDRLGTSEIRLASVTRYHLHFALVLYQLVLGRSRDFSKPLHRCHVKSMALLHMFELAERFYDAQQGHFRCCSRQSITYSAVQEAVYFLHGPPSASSQSASSWLQLAVGRVPDIDKSATKLTKKKQDVAERMDFTLWPDLAN